VTDTVRADATERLAIPMPGGTESLNVAAAAAILLYEALRQRRDRP
jgi:TrmH family RNA methyltransferase